MVMIPAETILMQEREAEDRAEATRVYNETRDKIAASRERLIAKLRLEAASHAQEARTANDTINRIYQFVSRGRGEPGNWNGPYPVTERFERLRLALQEIAGLDDSRADECRVIALRALEAN